MTATVSTFTPGSYNAGAEAIIGAMDTHKRVTIFGKDG